MSVDGVDILVTITTKRSVGEVDVALNLNFVRSQTLKY